MPDPPSASAAEARPAPELLRYKLTIAYDGTCFHGWQKQEPSPEVVPPESWPPQSQRPAPLRTVGGVVEQTLRFVLKQPIRLVGASRTDAGVHARGQVAHFDAGTRVPLERLADAINARLPKDVEIVGAEVVPPTFEAIGGATAKQYRYRLYYTKRRPLELRHAVHHCWVHLDLERMADAARRLVGTHDFAGFAAAGHGREFTVRTIFDCRIERPSGAPEVHIVVVGSGFLYNMVRIIAGTLVEVGRGRLPPDVVDRVLATADRNLAGPTMPPNGLWLEWIAYGERHEGT